MQTKVVENAYLLFVQQDITIQNIDLFKNAILNLLESDQPILGLELSEVTYVNSAALGYMADVAMKAKKLKKPFFIAGIHPNVAEVFRIVKFSTFISLFPTLEEALERIQN